MDHPQVCITFKGVIYIPLTPEKSSAPNNVVRDRIGHTFLRATLKDKFFLCPQESANWICDQACLPREFSSYCSRTHRCMKHEVRICFLVISCRNPATELNLNKLLQCTVQTGELSAKYQPLLKPDKMHGWSFKRLESYDASHSLKRGRKEYRKKEKAIPLGE